MFRLTGPDERVEPNIDANEKDMLCGWLDFHRVTILRKVDGAPADALWRPMVASGTSLLGLVKHLALAEHYWFVEVFAGDPPVLPRPNSPENFRAADGETPDDVVDLYRTSCERARRIVDGAALDECGHGNVENRRIPGQPFRPPLRWIVTHMIEETARHNGHADIFREQIDGATGL